MGITTASAPARVSRHIAVGIGFLIFAVVWTFPLAQHLSTHLPGSAPGDNVGFLWNFWWMRVALDAGLDVFHTTRLFAPFGADLTLHTHTALPAFAGATALRRLDVVTALNVTILASLALNGFCTYLLAWRITGDRGAAIVAGLVFGGSPFIASHLNGHFNLTTAWTIPLFALAASELVIEGSTGWAIVSGLLIGATAYIDYYYVVFQMSFGLCLCAFEARNWSLASSGPAPRSLRWARIVGACALVDLAYIVAIHLTGGFDAHFGLFRISARTTFNPLQALWVLVAISICLRLQPRLSASPNRGFQVIRIIRALAVVAGVFLLTAAPLVRNAVGLLARGEYVTQRYFWRNAPEGIDAATLLFGNPFHGLWGGWTRHLYESMRIDVVESAAWLGIAPVVLAVWALRGRWRDPAVRRWAALGGVFLVWSLGPHLMAFGRNTGMILPQALLRYVPIVSNARMPGRAIVVVFLALAVLSAVGVAEWRRRSPHRTAVLCVAACAVMADYLPAPFPVVLMDRPGIYETLRRRPERGTVCELPLGLRDGFGTRGFLDDRVLFYQTIHERPLVGGFVARLSPAVIASYEADPLLSTFLRLSGRGGDPAGAGLPDRQVAGALLNKNSITFVMLNRTTASPALTEYVEGVLPLTLVAQDAERSLYVVSRP